jgi:hypothetical protein
VLGSLRRKGLKSLVRDSWIVFDPDGREVGHLQEDSVSRALFRRFLGSLFFPQRFHLLATDGRHLATLRQHFNPFIYRLGIAVHADDSVIDDLVVLAAGCLIAAVEGRQDSGGGGLIDALTS